jgi:hypothetical protein
MSNLVLMVSITGLKSGKVFRIPLSYHTLDGVIHIFTGAPWLSNIADGERFEVLFKGQRREATAEIIADPIQVATALHRTLTDIGAGRASRFAFEVRGGVPPPEAIVPVLERRRMVRIRFTS